ncbi:MAG: iron ABC transporter permease [Chloroflexi bacterium]|nr:iron ABC transporter permease [Chloroflexota bacterium]
MAAAVLAAAVGPANIPLDATVRIVLSRLPGVDLADGLPQAWRDIIWEVRLPRVLLAGLVGATLALAGATYQGVFRNPLAEPYLIGVAPGAALAATAVLVSPVPYAFGGFSVLPLAAFAGGLTAVALAYFLARVGRTVPTTTLILAGIAISSIATSMTSFLMLLDIDRVFNLLAWVLGGFNLSSWDRLAWVAPYAVPAAAVLLLYGRTLNVLQLDDEQAQQLGVNVERTKLLLLGASSLATAAAVSVSGIIGFVGLIVPHAVRLVWGPDHRQLLPMSMLVGATFLILADLLAREVLQPSEVPVGIITSFCGVPFFLYLLRRAQRGVF